jgi:hypothetical protein
MCGGSDKLVVSGERMVDFRLRRPQLLFGGMGVWCANCN